MADELKEQEDAQSTWVLRARVGMHVTVEIEDKAGASEQLEFDLVPDAASNFSAGMMSERAPLARALRDHATGETIEYTPPSGNRQTVKIVDIRPSGREADPTGSDRKDVLGKVMYGIARRESRQIALTAELHYGSIDPDGIEEE